ncbi:MAG: amidohydrolase family protein [Pseudomonadota bacterium]
MRHGQFELFILVLANVIFLAHHGYAAPKNAALEELFLKQEFKQRSAKWNIQKARGTPRKIDFTIDEGTWMSVDIAPDGETIVFDLLGHIYSMPVSGGKAKSITQTSGIATNYHPKYSPDGTKIAFISDRSGQNNVWVMNNDGSNPRLILDDLVGRYAEPEWSADGRAIFATRFEPNARGGWTKAAEIWEISVKGSTSQRVIGDHSIQAWTPIASSDGRYLYYHVASEPIVAADGYYKISDSHHIRRFDLKTGRSEHVTLPEYRWYFRTLPFYAAAPALSRDGTKLAFMRQIPNTQTRFKKAVIDGQTGLYIRDLTTGEERLIAAPMTPAQFQSHSMYHIKTSPGYAWLPDDSGLIFSQGGKLRIVDLEEETIRIVPFEARVQREMSEISIPDVPIKEDDFKIVNPRWPALSPNGEMLAFEAVGRIWIKNLIDGNIKQLLSDHAPNVQMSPAWSSDGKQIAFTTWSDETGGAVKVVNVDGSMPRTVSQQSGAYLNPLWLDDDRHIAVVKGAGSMLRGRNFLDNGWQEIIKISVLSGEAMHVSNIPPMPTDAGQFSILHTGENEGIGFMAPPLSGDVNTRLFEIASNGSPAKLKVVFDGLAGDAQISPDGRWLAFQYAHNIYVVPRRVDKVPIQIIMTDSPATRQRQVSDPHGRYPHWGADGKLHFFSLDRYATCTTPFNKCDYEPLGLNIPSDYGKGVVAFRNATVFTSANAGVLNKATVVVKDGRISCVGDCDTQKADRTFNLKGKFLTPGFISIHEHYTDGGPDIFRPGQPELAKFLAYGVTSVMEPAGRVNVSLPEAEFLRAGKIVGPRLFSTSKILSSWAPQRQEIYNYEDARQTVQRLAGQGATSLKQYFQINRYQRQWLAEAARKQGDLLLTGEMMDLHYFLSAIMDGHTTLEHDNSYWPYYEDFKKFLIETDTRMSLTTVTTGRGRYLMEYFMADSDISHDPRERRFSHPNTAFRLRHYNNLPLSAYEPNILLQDIKELSQRGVIHGSGGHGEVQGLSQHWEMWSFALHSGAVKALESVTIDSARFLGIDKDVGSIEVGKLADFLVMNKDPRKKIRESTDTRYVVRGGRVYETDTLDQIWPEHKPFGAKPWAYRENEGGMRNLDSIEFIH